MITLDLAGIVLPRVAVLAIGIGLAVGAALVLGWRLVRAYRARPR